MSATGAAPYFDLPPGPELARRNRLIFADRQHWPAGAVVVCEEIEHSHPAWSVSWREENTISGFEAPAGFYADRRQGRRHLEPPLYGSTGPELVNAIRRAGSSCPACGARFEIPVGSECPPHPDGVEWCTVRCLQVTV